MLRRLPHQDAKVLPSNSRVWRRRTSSPPQGPPRNQSVGGLRTLRVHQGNGSAKIRGRKVQPRRASSRCEGRKPACSLCGIRAVRRLTHLRCWVVPGRDSSSSASSVRRVPSLHSAVEFNLAAIPPGLVSFPPCARSSLRCGPCSSPKQQSLPGSQDTAVPAVGAENAGQPPHNAAVKTVSLACTHPTPPVIHCAGAHASTV